jgi:hypothetical protein
MESSASDKLAQATRRDMIDTARWIIDAARMKSIVLRLFGGLAVRAHCQVIDFCERDYGDLDMVGLARQAGEIAHLMTELGYKENLHVRQATDGRQRQFYRPCEHVDAQAHFLVHPDDHIDVFLDTFRMDHVIPLKDRLTLDDYTISVTDTLLTKLQIYRLNQKDTRDILTLLKDLEIGDGERLGVVNLPYIASLCAGDWGLYEDVTANLEQSCRSLDTYGLSDAEVERIRRNAASILAALEQAPKPVSWRLRARLGARLPWHNVVDEQD